jgi:hypothetical protein
LSLCFTVLILTGIEQQSRNVCVAALGGQCEPVHGQHRRRLFTVTYDLIPGCLFRSQG